MKKYNFFCNWERKKATLNYFLDYIETIPRINEIIYIPQEWFIELDPYYIKDNLPIKMTIDSIKYIFDINGIPKLKIEMSPYLIQEIY